MVKDDKSGSNHKSEKLKIKYYTYINHSPKKRRLIQCSNCKEHVHKKLRRVNVIAVTDLHSDEKIKKQVEEIKNFFV